MFSIPWTKTKQKTNNEGQLGFSIAAPSKMYWFFVYRELFPPPQKKMKVPQFCFIFFQKRSTFLFLIPCRTKFFFEKTLSFSFFAFLVKFCKKISKMCVQSKWTKLVFMCSVWVYVCTYMALFIGGEIFCKQKTSRQTVQNMERWRGGDKNKVKILPKKNGAFRTNTMIGGFSSKVYFFFLF